MDQRKQPRFGVQLPISFEGEGFTGDGTVFNLSMEGCTMGSEEKLNPGTTLKMLISLSDQEAPMEVPQAVVVWSSEQHAGFHFTKLGSREQERLQRFVKTLEPESGD
ncbi:MAG: PilZ domain-containing protein [Nitrospiraceae bacterium]